LSWVLVFIDRLLTIAAETFRFPHPLQEDSTDMQSFNGLKIAILVLLFVLILRLLLMGWQKVAVSRTGEKFKFLLTRSPLSSDLTWRDVRYSVMVVIDALISVVILIWLMGKF
jgi:hypothetical protein